MPLTLNNWLLAFSPVVVILVLMLGLGWSGSRAGAAGWLAAGLIATLYFGANPEIIAYAQVKAILLSLDVLYIVWTALLFFHVANEAGAIDAIGEALPRLTPNRTVQGLLLGWLFASFLQGLGGFGVPVAVSAPLLVGMGFTPLASVVMSCIGHGWAVNFGSLATAFQTLMAVTNLPGELLAPEPAILLGIASFSCGMIVAYICGGWQGVWSTLPEVLILGCVMGGVQYFLVTIGLWTLGATGGASAGLLGGIVLARLRQHPGDGQPARHLGAGKPQDRRVSLPLALAAYLILVALAFAINLIPAARVFMNQMQLTLPFPELITGAGYVTPAEEGRKINIFGHPGAILIYSSIIAYLLYARAGYFQPGALRRIVWRVADGAVSSSLGIVAMVGMAVIMSHSGMTELLARGLSQIAGKESYAAAAPFIGALGAFITGSNNNSNVLFAMLQRRTAELLGLSITLVLAAQTAGGSLGSIMAPAKVIVGCSTVGLANREAAVLGKVIFYGLIPVVVVAVCTMIMISI